MKKLILCIAFCSSSFIHSGENTSSNIASSRELQILNPQTNKRAHVLLVRRISNENTHTFSVIPFDVNASQQCPLILSDSMMQLHQREIHQAIKNYFDSLS